MGRSPRAASLIAVLVIICFTIRPAAAALMALATLMLGVLLMVGGAGWAQVHVTFLNFIALPITFGIGAEYALNVVTRYREERDVVRAVVSTGAAVALCSWTTIVGYGSLLAARNRALQGFGLMAILGEVACLSAAIIAMPAVLFWRRAKPCKRRSHGARTAAGRSCRLIATISTRPRSRGCRSQRGALYSPVVAGGIAYLARSGFDEGHGTRGIEWISSSTSTATTLAWRIRARIAAKRQPSLHSVPAVVRAPPSDRNGRRSRLRGLAFARRIDWGKARYLGLGVVAARPGSEPTSLRRRCGGLQRFAEDPGAPRADLLHIKDVLQLLANGWCLLYVNLFPQFKYVLVTSCIQ